MVEFFDPIEQKGISYHLNPRLQKDLDKLNERRKKKDSDVLFVVDGNERVGKSVLTFQMAKYINPNFSLKNVCFSAEEFRYAVQNAKPLDVIVFDEAFVGLSSRQSLSKINKQLISILMQCGQLNLFIFIVLPSIFSLDKYISMWRSKALIHIFKLKNQRRMFTIFNSKNKKDLILNGAKMMTYGSTIKKNRITYKGYFPNIYAINEEKYRAKKLKAFKETEKFEEDSSMAQRNKLLYVLHKELGKNPYELKDLLEDYSFPMSRSRIQIILSKLKKEKEVKDKNEMQKL